MGTSRERPGRPYALRAGEGWTYRFPPLGADGIDFCVKAGEEPPDHTHPTEDEIFYVLEGDLTFRCGGETFEVEDGGFVFLPRGIEHGYQIRGDRRARLLVVTAPAPEDATHGWDGFVAGFERDSERRPSPPA